MFPCEGDTENITGPGNRIGLISIKFSAKIRGLINVSGFHVDPGFNGKLKFSVYNAGSRDAVFDPGQPLFTLWMCSFLQPEVSQYNGNHQHQSRIAAKDVSDVQGIIASPGELLKKIEELEVQQDKRMDRLENQWSWIKWVIGIIATLWIATFLRPLLNEWQEQSREKPANPPQEFRQNESGRDVSE